MATKTVQTLESAPAESGADTFAALAGVDIQQFIAQQVQEQLAQQQAQRREVPVVDASTLTPSAGPVPPKYLKHYRCDVNPDIQILRRDIDEGGTLGAIHRGEYLKFRRGHFFAMDQAAVDQLDWMSLHPQFDPSEPGRVVGGNPTIYEDDGRSLITCKYCTDQFVQGSNAYKSHLRATHGVTE